MSRKLGKRVIHSSKPEEDFEWDIGWVVKLRDCEEVIFDRFHLGGLVYGEMLGLHPVMEGYGRIVTALNSIISALNGEILILHEPDGIRFRDWLDEHWTPEEMFDIDMICEANNLFGQVGRMFGLPLYSRFPRVLE